MSRNYQGLIVLNTKSLEGSVDDLVAAVGKEIEAEGAKIGKTAQLGRRQFAYNARHLEAGHYVSYSFAGAPELISKIQTRLHLNPKVFLQFYQRLS